MTENYQQCAGDRVSLVSLGCFKSSPLNSHYAVGRNINRCSISEEQCGRNSIVGPYPRNILELMHRGLLSWNFTLEQKNPENNLNIHQWGMVKISMIGCT